MPQRVLLVDDDPIVVDMVGRYLKSQGFDTFAVGDGQSALEQVEEIRPDLVILDLILPGLNGYSVCSVLKKDPRHAHIPVIIFTKRLDETEEELKLLCGADAYVQKPFHADALMRKIRSVLQPTSNGGASVSPANDENSPI